MNLDKCIADQRHFSLSTEQWEAFVAALDRPPRLYPRLRRLFTQPSVLEEQK